MTPEQFKENRKSLGMSQRELARALGGVNERTLRRWETGEIDIPGPVQRLLRLFILDPDIAHPDRPS